MPQSPIALAPTKSSPLQEPISLQATGNYITIGAPGGPVVFADPGRYIVPGLAGSIPRNITHSAH